LDRVGAGIELRVIVPPTVREILDETIAQKLI